MALHYITSLYKPTAHAISLVSAYDTSIACFLYWPGGDLNVRNSRRLLLAAKVYTIKGDTIDKQNGCNAAIACIGLSVFALCRGYV